MLTPLSFGRGLNKDMKAKILNRIYSEEEIKQIYHMIINNEGNAKIAFISNAIVMFLFLVFITYQMSSGFTYMVGFGVIIMSVVYVICLLLLYYSLFKVQKRQFLNVIKKAYPELLSLFK